MKIQDIRVGKVSIPLKTPFKTALRRVDTAEDLIVQVRADDGSVGYGNAPATVVITGDSTSPSRRRSLHTIGPKLVGRDIDDREEILQAIQSAMVHNTSAKAALDIAVHDLFGQRYGMPLHRFFGGARCRVVSDLTVSVNEPAVMAADARRAVAAGYPPYQGQSRPRRSRRFPARPSCAAGCRAGYFHPPRRQSGLEAEGSRAALRRMEDAGLDIELVEQPVAAWDFEGLKQVDGSCRYGRHGRRERFQPPRRLRLLSMRACDLINVKLMKAGGLGPAAKIAALAESAGVGCMMGCMLESKVGITAAAALSAGRTVFVKNDLDAADLMPATP